VRWALLFLVGCDGVFGIQHIATPDAAPPDGARGYAAAVLADQPVAYWPLDEIGGVIAHDRAGGHDGQYKGPGITFGAAPPFASAGTAVSFDGTNAAVDLGDQFGFAGTAPYTIEVWFSPEVMATREYYEIICKWREPGGTTDPSGWNVFYSNSATSELQYTREALGHVTPEDRTAAPYTKGWHYVAATHDDAAHTMTLYYDGVEADSTAVTFGLDEIPEHLVIGATAVSPQDVTMYGSIGQVAIYDHALSATQISAHYAARSL
jgi:hypothetical protein